LSQYYSKRLHINQIEAIAAFIYSSVFPAATAFSMSASDIAAFEPRAKSSGVKGIPNLWAISFTFSWLALDSDDELAYAIDSAGAFWFLCFASTLEITSWAEGETLIALVGAGKVAKLTPIS